jgi:ubiquinone/menaquinone biosynthesis C-methylase UbiE
MSTEAVQSYYAQYDEWGRLDTPSGTLELERCLRMLNDHLEPHSRILDLGGGPGRYTIELARRGHHMTLIDLSDKHIRRARRELVEHGLLERIGRLEQGDARSLDSLDDDSFDAVVAFGPFYHLIEARQRRQAAGEIARVLDDGGLVFAQFLPPASGFVRLIDRAADHPEQINTDVIDQAMREHLFQNPTDSGFQEGYWADSDEMRALFEHVGIGQVDALSVRGIAAGREDKLIEVRQESPRLFEKIMELIEHTARLPEVIAMGQIGVWIGQNQRHS